jgi:hypothetical protein
MRAARGETGELRLRFAGEPGLHREYEAVDFIE